ncbi:hypothetical protein MUK42_21203 [Musa troglodytarum]|uniref:Uncharacterized protein n=1 Tax=Musa troglodytarum TaxID=320322 RepID=A0A9E7KRS2_9LILI|nr:hypothetical protein MUK42_21203 [Musa troglodytarum]
MAMASILPLLQLAADLAVAGISLMFVLGVFAFVAIVLCSVIDSNPVKHHTLMNLNSDIMEVIRQCKI